MEHKEIGSVQRGIGMSSQCREELIDLYIRMIIFWKLALITCLKPAD